MQILPEDLKASFKFVFYDMAGHATTLNIKIEGCFFDKCSGKKSFG